MEVDLIQAIKTSLHEVFWSFTPSRSQLEAMIKLDFNMGEARSNLMQLCFSRLASWPLLLVLVFLYFDPTKNSWSLQQVLGGQDFLFWSLDGRAQNMVMVFFIFFFLEWIFRKDVLFISILFYFLLKSDVHLNLALTGVLGTMLARDTYMWWLHIDLVSESRILWKRIMSMELLGWFIGAILSLVSLDYFHSQGFFHQSMTSGRFEFLITSVILIYAIQFLMVAAWGHFQFQKKKEPAEFPIHYSTANWFLRFRMRPYFKTNVQAQTEKYLSLHQKNLDELKTIKDLSPVSIPAKISQILQSELTLLKLASSRLTID